MLRRILATFWDGVVPWSRAAAADLSFWAAVDFGAICAPISADTLEVVVATAYDRPAAIERSRVSFLASDASDFACGGGQLRYTGKRFRFLPDTQFVSDLPRRLQTRSSAVREATAILWMLQSLQDRLRKRVVVFTDSSAACGAIKRGSRCRRLQQVVRAIFVWCVRRGVTVFPCWVPRDSSAITKADEWSRISDRFGQRTPPRVFADANTMARQQWGRGISFDRMASHLNAMPPPGMGARLPFNSLFLQPGSSGADMFLQPPSCWQREINFIHPPAPATGRVLTFLPSVRARAVVVIPLRDCMTHWWSNWLRCGSPGVAATGESAGFLIVVIDHSRRYKTPPKKMFHVVRVESNHNTITLMSYKDVGIQGKQRTLASSLCMAVPSHKQTMSHCLSR
jgi:hypothetical protein